ncbi:WxcM-like protein [Halobacteroides halobius DSM 5150]|uniref:WxcM-like protein n=1 Tax=Halobacteroides halobius (strain ATCC 35273 / DSM 5150 / MD-1) TaxID=748449 RepID=L0K4S8_HALHC|nr:WxcM-like protein [Halobacteroides halobius]AGB40272.1 WxcM-like protein [Halobacteroides halobius DSM 5150]
MTPNSDLLEIKEYTAEGYKPLIDYGEWRVAILKYCDELLPQKINKMQKHDQTDEVFVLLEGECILFLGEGEEEIIDIHAKNMEPLKLYNIKRSVWHTHTLSQDAVVLIVENEDTCLANSPEKELTVEQQEKLVELTNSLWD